MKRVNLVGNTYGYLLVESEGIKNKWNKIQYNCICKCGSKTLVLGRQLLSGRTKSCGCLQKEAASKANTKHGMQSTTEYRAWRTIRDHKNEDFSALWNDFAVFYKDLGDRPSKKHMICKYDLNLGYSKENCYWGLGVKRKDFTYLIGAVFTRLTVITVNLRNKYNQPVHLCRCLCGNKINVTTNFLESKETQSCGCLQKELAAERSSDTQEDFLIKALNKHSSKYDYTLAEYTDHKTPVKIVCKDHGIFEQAPSGHLQGYGCPTCGIERTTAKNVKSQEQFINEITKIHGSKYDYSLVKYVKAQQKVTIVCKIHGSFLQKPMSHLIGQGCPNCAKRISKAEVELADYIEDLGFKIERNTRKILGGNGKEADIFIPSKNIIIEYDGSIWHSERFAKNKYNIKNKTDLALSYGYQCIHVREDQWLENKNLVKNLLKTRLGLFENRIGARKTVKKDITQAEYRSMCQYHLQGYRNANYKRGLFTKDTNELVAVIGYDVKGELIRYIVKQGWQIQGALPKLIKGESIKFSFCDLSFFDGNSYPKAGFNLDYITKPNYRYTKAKITLSRNSMMKHKLKGKLKIFDEDLTEKQNCEINGWYRLYDCGNAKYILS